MNMETRVCKKCGEKKELSDFQAQTNAKGIVYYSRTCKKCSRSKLNETQIKWRAENKEHIQEYNWDNYGLYNRKIWDDNDSATWTWQIDHIVPHSNFEYKSMDDNNFKMAWDLSNLRPLSSKQNVLDGTSRIRHRKAA